MIKNYIQLAIEFEEWEHRAVYKQIAALRSKLAIIMANYDEAVDDETDLQELDFSSYEAEDRENAMLLVDDIKELEACVR